MFEKLRYKYKTKGYFNPNSKDGVSREQLLQILKGEFINLDRLEGINSRDYSFMMVGVPLNSPPNSWNGQSWGVDGYENAQIHSDWYAKISCKTDSNIVFPKQNLVFGFNPCSKYSYGKSYKSLDELGFVLFGGKPSIGIDRDLKIVVSNVGADEVLKYIRDYKSLF